MVQSRYENALHQAHTTGLSHSRQASVPGRGAVVTHAAGCEAAIAVANAFLPTLLSGAKAGLALG